MVNKKRKSTGRKTLIKRYIKLIAASPDPVQNLALIKNCPDDVLKTVCNAAINVTHGKAVHLTPKQKSVFRKYKDPISKLVHPDISLSQKRRQLVQHGGAFFLPLLLSTALPILANLLFNK